MKNLKNLSWLSLVLAAFLFISCSSDDDKSVDENVLQLEGEWKFETMNFLDGSVQWDPEVEYTSANTFGYAPYMFEAANARGMIFGTDPVTSDAGNLGKRFDYILGADFGQDEDVAYWYWNYTDQGESFMMQQVNPSFPPHDYTINNISDFEMSQDGNRVDFKGTLKSRIVGGTMMEMEDTPVEFTLIRGTATTPVEILIEGEPFVAPE